MPAFLSLILYLLLSCSAGWAHAADWLSPSESKSEYSQSSLLVYAPEGLQADRPIWLGLRLQHAPDWHSYWRNPGDSGLPIQLEWQVPAGVHVGDVHWPTPKYFPLGELANYGYDGTVLLPAPVRLDPSFNAAQLEVHLSASWLICRKECVPEEASFTVRLNRDSSQAEHAALFQQAFDAVPRDLAAGNSTLTVSDQGLDLSLSTLPAAWRGRPLSFFPETPNLIQPGAPWEQQWSGSRWTARLPLSTYREASPERMTVVLAPQVDAHAPVIRGERLVLPVRGTWPPLSHTDNSQATEPISPTTPPTAGDEANRLSWWLALTGALLGGVLLNLMPCVFPVLAIKVLAFTQHGDAVRLHRLSGLAYTAGVTLSFTALGGLLLILRSAGEQLGWGFQLQNPLTVAALALLFAVIGFHLAGLFEWRGWVPSAWAGIQLRHPVADAFFTGVLATAVASPCTAPFMGASLGAAITLPPGQAIGIFVMLGAGMALPYLAASWLPGFARRLPRPGPWMDHFRQAMAFPMFATVVWLLWVLGQQTGIDGASTVLMLLVGAGFLAWSTRLSGRTGRWVFPLTLCLWVASAWSTLPRIEQAPPTLSGNTPTRLAGLHWEHWSAQRQSEHLAAGRTVFIDFTAAWCVTCQYNKQTALADTRFLNAAQQGQVVLMRADWTRRDPEVTQALNQLGRSGVPVYAVYRPGVAPQVLTEILSVEELLHALAAAGT